MFCEKKQADNMNAMCFLFEKILVVFKKKRKYSLQDGGFRV